MTAKQKSSKREAAAAAPVVGDPIGRIPVIDVSPVLADGAYPAKAVIGERIPIRATVFREGHDAVGATVVLTGPDGRTEQVPMTHVEPKGLDGWEAWVRLDAEGAWTFRIETWDNPWATWRHDAEIKFAAGMDVDLMCTEGRLLLTEAQASATEAGDHSSASYLQSTSESLRPGNPMLNLVESTTSSSLDAMMRRYGPRRLVTATREYPLFADRQRALFSSWYEFFPRSQGATWDEQHQVWRSGGFDGSHERLEAAAAMGFDVVYLPPIHPVGTAFRKGPNNTLTPGPDDVGSPWAIGAPEGGHDAIHPDLGDEAAFARFVDKARDLGLEVALDLALQASPDHPWVTEHPEWFTERADGTIAYAENPPKKYQDIYPINFDRDPEGIYAEVLRVVKLWMSRGVRIFRVDNPHTKPVSFWARLLAEVRSTDPDVLFLAEAFTRPAMMRTLGMVGFHQSYTYFTWRNEKWEIEEYIKELSTETAAYMRPNFWPNTPDILNAYLVHGGPAAFSIRAVLAATLSPSWGLYSGYELFENEPVRPGSEEYLDSEKYQIRSRDFGAEPNLSGFLGTLNAIRRRHPALQQLRQTVFHHAPHHNVIAYSRHDGDDTVIVVCSLDPHNTVESEVYLDMAAMGLEPDALVHVTDEITGAEFTWGARAWVRLAPLNPAHILRVRTAQAD